MGLSDLMLRKEEIPILHEGIFQLPIHPLLINPGIRIDVDLAPKLFPQAAEEWYEDLKTYRETEDLDDQTKEWLDAIFLNEKPKVKGEYGEQSISNGVWRDNVVLDDNGFATIMCINRNSGGTIYFNKGESGCEALVLLGGGGMVDYIQFSEEKAREFGFEEIDLQGGRKGVLIHVYNHHNVDSYPGALFLRNWGILYLNKALESMM